MLVLLCVLGGLGLAIPVCLCTGVFSGLQFLYLLPLWFAVGFLGVAALAVLFLVILVKRVDMNVLPMRTAFSTAGWQKFTFRH